MTYQSQLTTARRDACWRSLEAMRQRETRALELQMARPAPKADAYQHWQGERETYDRGAFALAVVAVCAALGVLGMVVGLALAVWQAIGGGM